MLNRLISKLEPVRIATSPEEREAIYRFRYDVYAREFGRELGGPDHERGVLTDAEDEQLYTELLYTGSPTEITGTLRLRHWPPGQVPEHEVHELSMNRFPDFRDRTIAEIGRLMISRRKRGKFILASLTRFAYKQLVGEHRIDMTFSYCSPGLVQHYRKLGYRPFGGTLVHAPDGAMVPVVMIPCDYDYYRQVGSFLAPEVKRHFGTGKRTPLNLASYRQILDDNDGAIALDPEDMLTELQDALVAPPPQAGVFVSALPEKLIPKLTTLGYLFSVPAGITVTRAGFVEQEIYLVLEGEFEVLAGEQRLRTIGPGSLFGELAFFLPGHKRSATVRALTEGRLLVLRGSSLRKLIDKDPRTAAELLLQIGREMAGKLADDAGAAGTPGSAASRQKAEKK